jgi:hypothetical protein
MLTTLASLTAHASRQVTELGALLGLLGGLALAAGVLPFMRKFSLIVAGLLIAVGFLLVIYALHFGVNPYKVMK